MSSVLILANEHVQSKMAGPAIRCYEFARELAAAGHQTTLASPFPSDLTEQPFRVAQYDDTSLADLAASHQVIVLQGWVMERFPFLRDCGARLVVDLYDPFPLEVLVLFERETVDAQVSQTNAAITAVADQIRDADFFLCASERQLDYWLGALTMLNRVNPYTYGSDPTLRSLIDVVPFGIPSQPPNRSRPAIRGVVPGIGEEDIVLLWGGGIYNWFDPVTLIDGIAIASREHPSLRLVFMSTGHPNPEIQEMWTVGAARRRADELGIVGRHVFFNDGWVDYDARGDWFLEADIGVTTHFDHIETRFSFRTRVLDYFWAGLPVICTAGDTLAETVETRGLGATVPPGDADAIARAVSRLATDPAERRRCAEAVLEYAATLRWSQAIAPLRRYCDNPRAAADRVAIAPARRMPLPVHLLGEDVPPVSEPTASLDPTDSRSVQRALRRFIPNRIVESELGRYARRGLHRLRRSQSRDR
jgi:glycosyltransferase involved in cell wall biosynthesis